MCLYKVEEITYNDRRIYIVCQDKNDPCPLIAVANYIILCRGLNLKPDSNGFLSQNYLFTLVRIHLNAQLAKLFQEDKIKTAQAKELLALLPNFAKDFFINPHVNSISGFDKTPELTLIECLGIPLIHGWIVDDKDSKTASAEAIQSTEDEDAQEPKHNITQQHDEITCELIMDNTRTQLTSHGVSCLRDYMLKEGNELAVLYWNEHFHLMHMHHETLHTLQTNLGIRTIHPNAVWQTLDPMYKDIFVTDEFMPINDEEMETEENILYLQHQFEWASRRMEMVDTADKLMKGEIAALRAELEEVQKQKPEKALENFAIKVAEASQHENELLETIEKEKQKQEKNAKKMKKHKKRRDQSIEVIPDSAPGTTPLQQEQSIEVIPDGAPPGTTPPIPDGAPPGSMSPQQEQSIEVTLLPYDAKWVSGRFLKFLTNFNYYGKSETPYFEGEIEAMKYRNLFEMSMQYADIRHDCEELAIIIRDNYDSVLEVLRGSVKQYLVEHGVEEKKAEEAVLKIHGRPTSYRSFVDFAEENRNALIEFVEIYTKTFAKSTTELGRRMARGYLRYIINMHRKGFCWNGDWKASDMKVRSDGRDFIITKVPDYNISKEGMKADFEKFFEIVFPFYAHETKDVNQDSGEIETKQVLPSYFEQFQVDCKEVPDPNMEPVKLENFQKFLGCHPAFMSPMTMVIFIGNLFICCYNLRGEHDIEFNPLQLPETLLVDWKSTAKNLCKPFADIYWHFSAEVYALGYWFFLKFLRNFIQHMRTHKQDHDIALSGVMIGHYLAQFVPALILYILNNCDMNSLFFSTTWNKFEESD